MPRDLPSPRRSRRANGSSTTSKSPDAVDVDGDFGASGSGTRNGNKRLKHEDDEDEQEPIPPAPPARGGRRKKEKPDLVEHVQAEDADDPTEEEGTTRCICDELEVDGGDFMVMCEQCSVWQHGVCMGLDSESDVPDEYFCENCRPELHQKAMLHWHAKRRERSGRQSSTSHHTTNGLTRHSRSQSPAVTLKQASKRRNTMNSRDADFDEITKQILEVSAAEAAALEGHPLLLNGHSNGHRDEDDEDEDEDEDDDSGPSASRKRRRGPDDDPMPFSKKRTRSASTASEHPISAAVMRGETPSMQLPPRKLSVPILAPAPKGHGGRGGKRGGARKAVVPDPRPTPDGDDDPTPNPPPPPPPPAKRGGWGGRGRGGHRKAQTSHITQLNEGARGRGAGVSINSQIGESSKANRNSHAYVVSQQVLHTSWNLPDYLSHLQPLLPAETPPPLEVRHGPDGDRSLERGVKVKWPGKRMSVVDMNKRVRALVEWVGREQASALDRSRRKEALEKAVKEERLQQNGVSMLNGHVPMMVDQQPHLNHSPEQQDAGSSSRASDVSQSTGSLKLMEDLMQELIGFQERFGPGRNREREKERRTG